ncbi:MAG: flavin reductase family protein [Cloacibacillus evryensis]
MTWKAGTMLYPLPPVMVSCGTMEKSNIITVAWTGTVNSEPPMTYVSVRPERYSYGLIKETGEFVINLTTDRLVWNADFCGVKSGRYVDKFALPGLTAIAASEVSAPMIERAPSISNAESKEACCWGATKCSSRR